MQESSTRRPVSRVLVVLLGLMLVLLVVKVFVAPFGWGDGDRHRRTPCMANLSSIGKGLHAYANENHQGMPISAHAPASQPATAPADGSDKNTEPTACLTRPAGIVPTYADTDAFIYP